MTARTGDAKTREAPPKSGTESRVAREIKRVRKAEDVRESGALAVSSSFPLEEIAIAPPSSAAKKTKSRSRGSASSASGQPSAASLPEADAVSPEADAPIPDADSPPPAPPLHSGHRERLRKRFQQEGLEGFADHQVLELLLFHALPRRDTNPIAHLLLQRYGSLSGVFEADAADLALAPGVGAQAGLFLSLIPAVTRRYMMDSLHRRKPALNRPEKSKQYVLPLMAGRTEEVFYVLCLDSRNRLIHPALVGEGTVRDVVVHPRQVVEAALRHRACSVILAHNHPSGNPRPSAADFQLTRELIQALESIQIRVLDHLISGGQEVVSMSEEGLLGE